MSSDQNSKKSLCWDKRYEYGVYRDEHGYARGVDGTIIHVSKEDTRAILERASMNECSYICLPERAEGYTPYTPQSDTYTKDEIDQMIQGICGAQGRLEDDFYRNIEDVYFPINDNIGWLTTLTYEMKQDITMLQQQQRTRTRS